MIFANGDTVTLRDLHKKLNLSQSSLPTSVGNLPERLHFAGLLISYDEIQLVSWKKEIIFTITDGDIETLKISMWLNNENPVGFRFNHRDELLGHLIFAKNVQIKSFDFTDPTDLQFYGEMNPPEPSMHTILFPIISGGSFAHYENSQRPFNVNDVMSIIPRRLAGKRSVSTYPTIISPPDVTAKSLETVRIYVTCIAKDIQFGHPRNSLQKFINMQNSRPVFSQQPVDSKALSITTLRRRYRAWLLSYDQTKDWIRRQTTRQVTEDLQKMKLN